MTIILRPIMFSLCAIWLFAACNNKPETTPVSQKEISKQIVEEHFRYLNNHDLKSLVAQYGDKAKITTVDWDGEAIGPQGADQIYHQVFYISPDARYLVDNVINGDSIVVVEYDIIGLKEKAGSTIRYDMRNCSVFKIKNDKITAESTYANSRLYHSK